MEDTMGTDKSEPRIGLIVFVGVFVIVVLLSVRAGLVAYFDLESRAEEIRKAVASRPEARLAIQAEESRNLASGPLPIDRAMGVLGSKGRVAASLQIQPQASKDVSPLMGWMQMPATVPAPMVPELDASADASIEPDGKSIAVDAARPDAAPTPGKPKSGRGTGTRSLRDVP